MAKIIFRNMIDVQALRERVGAEVLQHPRFSAKLVRAPDSKKGVADCAFEEVAEVDMAYHVREIDCVGWEQAELDEYLEKIDTTGALCNACPLLLSALSLYLARQRCLRDSGSTLLARSTNNGGTRTS